MNVAEYQAKVYPSPPCWMLVADVYAHELTSEVNTVRTVNNSVRQVASEFRLQLHKDEHGFERIEEPVNYAVVLMGKTARLGFHHCGVYYDGKVLHANDEGVLYEDLNTLRDAYPLMEFWAK